jgi:predicted Zn-dependent protease
MKIFWNSLLISLGILLPTSTSIALAEPTRTVDQITLNERTAELVSLSSAEVLIADETSASPTQQTAIIPAITPAESLSVSTAKGTLSVSSSSTLELLTVTPAEHSVEIADKTSPASTPPTVVVPAIPSEETPAVPATAQPSPVSSPEATKTPPTTTPTPTDGTGTKEPNSNPEAVDNPETTETSDSPDAGETKEPNSNSEATDNAETTETSESPDATEAKEPELSPEEIARRETLIKADQLYQSGQITEAQKLYQEAKEPFSQETVVAPERPEPIYDPAKLTAAGSVYWRQSEAGLAQKLETKIFVPLQFLVEQYPEFIPGHLRYAQALKDYGKPEEALQVLEQATALYPGEPELLKANIAALDEQEKWLEASLAAREFALLYPDNPQSSEFAALADKNLERYKRRVRRELRGNAIGNAITGALGFVLTGNLYGPISAIDSTVMLLRGESSVGESVAKRAKRQLPMMEDEEVLNYVREVGTKLANVTGRTDFTYEFYVVMDDDINAFSLPGGKLFVNAGAILHTNSEAELAGLLAHELSHAVLSHGFQLVTQGNLTANVTQFFPYGGTLANLLVLDYSRDMERQADELGTRILASSGYAADGMHNLMVTLDKEEPDIPLFSWLSSHPDTKARIKDLESLIERNGYNRYAYEGVARHLEMQKRVAKLLKEYKEREKKKR